MANVQATLRARLPHESDLARLAAELDREIDETTPGAVYLTLFLGILDTGARRAAIRQRRAQPAVRDSRGRRLRGDGRDRPADRALSRASRIEEVVVPARPGDLLFFYTDGLVEAEDESGDMFGVERLKTLLGQEQTHGVDTVLHEVEEAVRRSAEPRAARRRDDDGARLH